MISALVVDMLDRSRFPDGVTFVRDGAQLDPAADVIVVDLSRPDALVAIRRMRGASKAWIVGYGRHTDVDTLSEARAAGCDRVLARSAFFADVTSALRG